MQRIQTQASAGTAGFVYYLNPVEVALKNLPLYGFTPPLQLFPRIVVTVTYHGTRYDIHLAQPLRTGAAGIWVVNRIASRTTQVGGAAPTPTSALGTPGPRVGVVTPSRPALLAIQVGADAHNPAYTYYLNPIQVVARNLSRYGFTGTFTIVPRLTVRVYDRGKPFDATLSQPARQGPSGIWLITHIRRSGPA